MLRIVNGSFSFVTAPQEKNKNVTIMLAQNCPKNIPKVASYGRFDLKIGTGLKKYPERNH